MSVSVYWIRCLLYNWTMCHVSMSLHIFMIKHVPQFWRRHLMWELYMSSDTWNVCLIMLALGQDPWLYAPSCFHRCCMALLHSRVQRVFFCHSNPSSGGLCSQYKLHLHRSLNHHFRVYKCVLSWHFVIYSEISNKTVTPCGCMCFMAHVFTTASICVTWRQFWVLQGR